MLAQATIVFGRKLKVVGLIPFRWLSNVVTLVIGNPIIAREMKVRMRFARAFWVQGAYLFFLIVIIAVAYQGIIAQQPLHHPVELQRRLQEFYFVLLYSIVGIVVLIAPALTAGAISFERERRTLDLLLITPLRPMQILFGKLVTSFAFLLLLLSLSMPVVTVCILMGGATVGDLLATYAMVALSTLHLCAFALYCSACNRSSGAATFWAYLGVAGILGLTFPMVITDAVITVGRTAGGMMGVPTGLPASVIFPLASLHPFGAPVIKALPTQLYGVTIPCWLFCVVFSFLLTRFWLTAAMAKLPAVYQGNLVGSLRRQGLVFIFLAVLSVDAVFNLPMVGATLKPSEVTLILFVLLGVVAAAIALFIPWIATFGEHEGNPPANDGWFRPLRMFRPVASGALPFVLTCYAIVSSIMIAVLVWRMKVQPLWTPLFIGIGYWVLLLTFLWAIGRFWSALVNQLNLARWLTVSTAVLIAVLPGISEWSLAYPVIRLIDGYDATRALSVMTEQVLVHGTVVGILTVGLFLASCIITAKRRTVSEFFQRVSVSD